MYSWFSSHNRMLSTSGNNNCIKCYLDALSRIYKAEGLKVEESVYPLWSAAFFCFPRRVGLYYFVDTLYLMLIHIE